MLPVLQIGPLAVQTPGLVILLSLWLGLSLSERYAVKRGVDPNQVYNLAAIVLLAGVIGARLAYAGRYPAAFFANPASLVSLYPGLMDAWGGMAAGLLAGAIYGQQRRLPLWPVLDALTPALALVAVGQGFANLASGSGFGAESSLPWAVELFGARRHPTQVYEILSAALILAFLWPGRKPSHPITPGAIFLSFIALSSGMRLFLEGFRADSLLVAGGFRQVQLIALLMLVVSLVVSGRLTIPEQANSPTSQVDAS